MSILGPISRRLQRILVHDRFSFWQRLGVHVVPNHFYQPIPDTRDLANHPWNAISDLPGISINEPQQKELLAQFTATYKGEYEQFPRQPTGNPHSFYLDNNLFASVDAEILYCLIRHFKPRRIFEVGSGFSTLLSAQAALRNIDEAATPCDLIAFEPYPNKTLQSGFPGLTRLMRVKAQDIPLETFSSLEAGDILFIDSSHVLKTGSDVQWLFLEALPRIRPGVLVHVHDIFFPTEYPKAWVMDHHKFWNEQYILQAFLAFNSAFEVLWAAHYMHIKHSDLLQASFASYDPVICRPGSFWLRRTC